MSTSPLHILPALDSPDHAAARRRELDIPHEQARSIAKETVGIIEAARYRAPSGRTVDLSHAIELVRTSKRSLPPEAALPAPSARHAETVIQVANETTTAAALRLLPRGRTIALNFANGTTPGGGFLGGARAQEECLCRASALYATLVGDAMYDAHAADGAAASDWAILSPDVPFFRDDAGALLDEPFLLSVLTCAAPVASIVGAGRAAEMLRHRIGRVLAIMAAFDYEAGVLGAWGCGAFGNDPRTTAIAFREALEGPFAGAFREVIFAITDWSPERRFLGPFAEVFAT